LGLRSLAKVLGLISSLIWQRKGGGPVAGFFLGAGLGLIGLVIVVLSNPTKVEWDQKSREARREPVQR
jgi:hypothetical protein